MKKVFFLLSLILLASFQTWAQGCTMCTETAAHLGEKGAKGLNFGILYLAAIPTSFMVIVAVLWYKKSKR